MNYASQAWIMLFGPIAILLVNSRYPRTRMYGAIIGVIGGIGWYTQMVLHDQWLLLPMHLFYTIAWIRGIVNHGNAWRRAALAAAPPPAQCIPASQTPVSDA